MTNPEKHQPEQGGQHQSKGTQDTSEQPATVTLTEAEVTRLREADRRLTAAEERAEAAEGQVADLTDRVASMERDARHKRFTDLVAGRGGSNDGQPWFGDPEKHVAILETLADIAGEDGEQVMQYIEQQTGIAAQLASSNLFAELGSSAGSDDDTTEARITALVKEKRKSEPRLTREQAVSQVYSENPDLYEAELKGDQ